ncbi:uncharacterized protein N7498_007405 [Penicillium cinerascens]|uniref:LYR family protein n=1 Tax=Penicillium cinerascens TaxID=70096 RepID=A0A9W9JK00_9EURO|nr:uncharacterized protein N7498_007405 [Penicillium cinerascens]KAJ5198288.1 hypothetical protein N7498_007405 [Penicillium cinerascens]
MPSTFRSSRSGRHLDGPNRTRTGQIDHDVFEGLPVRRWSKQPHTYSQAPKAIDDSDFGVQGPGGPVLPELPMPRDSDLLPAVSKALLRAARAGCIYIRQNTTAADKEDNDTSKTDDQVAGVQMADRSFTSRKWLTLPKHMEPPEAEFLAKRRPGLSSLYGGSAVDGSSGSLPMRRTKFKKVDPQTGNISIYEAWVPEGHRIEGEVTGDVQTIAQQSSVPVKPETPAPGTIVEGVGIVNSEGVVVAEAGSAAVLEPPKRRPPPPKRKSKGIGKGRKKKVMFAPGEGADAATVHGVASGTEGGAPGSQEGQDGSRMSVDQSGQDDDDEEGDESDEGDESMVDAKTPETPGGQSVAESTPQPSADTPAESKDVDMTDAAPEPQPPASESAEAGQELLSQPSAGPSETPQNDADISASVSATPGLLTENSEEPTTEQPVPTTMETAGEVAPIEEFEVPEPASIPAADSAAEPSADETPAQEASQLSASEVKDEAQFEGIDENSLASPSTDLEKPVDEPSEPAEEAEPEQPRDVSEQATETKPVEEPAQPPAEVQSENALATEGTEGKESDPSETDVGASEAKEEVEMGDAPAPLEAPQAEPPTAQSPVKSASPIPPAAAEPQPATEALEPALGTEETAPVEAEAEPEVPEPSTEVEQEEAPAPEPAQTEPASEEKKDEPEAPPAEST